MSRACGCRSPHANRYSSHKGHHRQKRCWSFSSATDTLGVPLLKEKIISINFGRSRSGASNADDATKAVVASSSIPGSQWQVIATILPPEVTLLVNASQDEGFELHVSPLQYSAAPQVKGHAYILTSGLFLTWRISTTWLQSTWIAVTTVECSWYDPSMLVIRQWSLSFVPGH